MKAFIFVFDKTLYAKCEATSANGNIYDSVTEAAKDLDCDNFYNLDTLVEEINEGIGDLQYAVIIYVRDNTYTVELTEEQVDHATTHYASPQDFINRAIIEKFGCPPET